MPSQKPPKESLRYALGIDAGCASIGWAVVLLDKNDNPEGLHATGVRRFDAGVEGDITRGRDESKSRQRREARGPRRNTMRRQRRMRKVFNALQKAGLLPESTADDHDARHALFLKLDQELGEQYGLRDDHVLAQVAPYHLRAAALDEPLPAHALGRALYHLAQRRGFQSNLKANRGDEEEGKVKAGISELEKLMDRANARTLGEYFAGIDPEERRIRQRWTARQMYRDEFDAIWQAQQPHHPQLTEEFRERLEEAIFHQRPLKSQKGLIGKCDLEPFKRRAPIACLAYQQFRLLQKVNDLEIQTPDDGHRRLSPEERQAVLSELTKHGDLTWAALRKALGIKKLRGAAEGDYEFNFEQGGDKKLPGARTASKFAAALNETWDALSPEDRALLVDDVLAFEDPERLISHLQSRWSLTEQQSVAVSEIYLEPGYGSVSRRAARKLTEAMKDGARYSEARKAIYPESFEAEEVEDRLPPVNKFLLTLRNPAVARTLSELRKVVNALIEQYGMKPAFIRIELARDLKRSRLNRKQLMESRDKNTKSRQKAFDRLLSERGASFATPHNILKVRLAEECGWTCPYTGDSFNMDELIGDSSQFDVEHIIPFSLSFDNSYANKTLCRHDENRHVKKNRTPFQAYGSTPKWEEILQRVKHFQGDAAKRKLQLFQAEKLTVGDDFINRQLSDTRYLSRVAADYLSTLYGGRYDADGVQRVQASPGRVTAMLRRTWGLNRLGLGDPDLSDEKDRADHRHHAIDAFVIAVTSPSVIRDASKAAQAAESYYDRDLLKDILPPWPSFTWKDLGDSLERIVVSSRVDRKLNGKLHEDTILSEPHKAPDPKKPGSTKTYHHVRKPLERMSRKEVEAIVDPAIRQAVIIKLDAIGGTPDKAFSDKNHHPYLTTKDGRLIPIHAARIRKADKPITVGKKSRQRHVSPGDNHHMEIVAVLDAEGKHKKWEGVVVSRFEAMERFRNARKAGVPAEIIRRDHGPDREFVFSLAGGEHVAIPDGEGTERLLRVTVISGQQIEFVEHHDARPITVRKTIPGARVRYSIDKLRQDGAKKVQIDPLGKKKPAGD